MCVCVYTPGMPMRQSAACSPISEPMHSPPAFSNDFSSRISHTQERQPAAAAYFILGCCVPLGELVITWFISPLYLLPIERWPRINHSLVTPWIAKSIQRETAIQCARGGSNWTFLDDAYNGSEQAMGVAQSAFREMSMAAQHTQSASLVEFGCHWITFLHSNALFQDNLKVICQLNLVT